jgi:transcriptional regulator with XRE-family HTH domain
MPPPPPPEAVLIRLVREAAGLKLPAVAKLAGISKARWSQVETGYEMRLGKFRPVQGTRSTIAHMAYAVGLEPARLATEGARPDAAAVLAEILRSAAGAPDPQDLTDAELRGELEDLTRRIEELRNQNRLRLGGKANGDTKQQRRA